jgi:hypothetical protein
LNTGDRIEHRPGQPLQLALLQSIFDTPQSRAAARARIALTTAGKGEYSTATICTDHGSKFTATECVGDRAWGDLRDIKGQQSHRALKFSELVLREADTIALLGGLHQGAIADREHDRGHKQRDDQLD